MALVCYKTDILKLKLKPETLAAITDHFSCYKPVSHGRPGGGGGGVRVVRRTPRIVHNFTSRLACPTQP
jgi:hypothetical protein